ncbi:hypothetical protein [Aquitalea pelogenes]|uniref:hypothetical protein n=1 Tax=Aquitalea pelogenes TaxID=1293573 RepID=UPI0035B0707C
MRLALIIICIIMLFIAGGVLVSHTHVSPLQAVMLAVVGAVLVTTKIAHLKFHLSISAGPWKPAPFDIERLQREHSHSPAMPAITQACKALHQATGANLGQIGLYDYLWAGSALGGYHHSIPMRSGLVRRLSRALNTKITKADLDRINTVDDLMQVMRSKGL